MPKVLVVFGSSSDKDVYGEISNSLKEAKVEHDVKVSSAHRTPEDVELLASGNYDLFVAGAGLAAALPGVVASKTIRPVIGVPVGSNFKGLDAFLSITQMPPGIPVASAGVGAAKVAADYAARSLKTYNGVNLIGDKNSKAYQKAKAILDEFEVPHKESEHIDPNSINISFVYFDEPIEKKDEFVIYCPLLLPKDDNAEAAINLLKHSSHGLWVGLNRGDNAALFAIEVLNIDNSYSEKIEEYRQNLRDEIRGAK